jgi:MFS family permease
MVVVFLASIAIAANRFKVPPVLPTLMGELQVDMVTGGWLMSVTEVAGIILAIPTALLLTRFGLKVTGLFALGCAMAGSVIGALATGAFTMLVGRAIEGISFSLMAVLAPTAISLWFPARERGLPMGIWASWVPVGNVVMFNIAHPLMNGFGWRSVWWAGVLFSSIAFLLVGLVVASPPQSASERRNASSPRGDLGQMVLNPSAWLLALAFGAFTFCLLGYNTWAPQFLTNRLDIDPATANAYASFMFLAAIPSNILAGWAINHVRDRSLILPTAFLITTILFFWSFRLGTVSMVVPYMVALGITSNFIPTATFTLAPQTMPRIELAALALGIVRVGSSAVSVVGPPALGAVLGTGNWSAGSACLVIVMGVGTIISWTVAKGLRSD